MDKESSVAKINNLPKKRCNILERSFKVSEELRKINTDIKEYIKYQDTLFELGEISREEYISNISSIITLVACEELLVNIKRDATNAINNKQGIVPKISKEQNASTESHTRKEDLYSPACLEEKDLEDLVNGVSRYISIENSLKLKGNNYLSRILQFITKEYTVEEKFKEFSYSLGDINYFDLKLIVDFYKKNIEEEEWQKLKGNNNLEKVIEHLHGV